MWIPNIKPISQKRIEQLQRNSSSQRYQEWRLKVLCRDDNKCQFPGCREHDKLQVHHIRRFADARHLRYEEYNGITLCEKHHQEVTGHESVYELAFFKISMANKEKKEKESQIKLQAENDETPHSN
jgi:hypothetical protein